MPSCSHTKRNKLNLVTQGCMRVLLWYCKQLGQQFSFCDLLTSASMLQDGTSLKKEKTNFRTITYYPLSALVTLFVSILENPSQPRNQADLDNMRFVCDFLKTVTIGSETTVATAWPNELARIAEEAMVNARADRGVTRQVKRGNSKFLGASPFCDDQYLQQQPEVLSTSTSSEDIGGGGLSCNYSKQYQENYLMPSSQQLPNAQPIQANSETWQIPTNINFEYLFSDEFVNADPRQISDDSYEPDFTFFM